LGRLKGAAMYLKVTRFQEVVNIFRF